MKEYEIVKTKLNNQDYDFEGDLLTKLTEEEFAEINEIICREIYKGNEKCYKFIKHLKGLYLAKLMSSGHNDKIGDDNWIALAANVYLSYPKPSLLEYIIEKAKSNKKALEQLKIIAQQKPEIFELNEVIQNIEMQNINSFVTSEKKSSTEFQYYQLEFGAIVKVKKEDFLLYRLDPKTKEWIEDHELFMEMANGGYGYETINITDNFVE